MNQIIQNIEENIKSFFFLYSKKIILMIGKLEFLYVNSHDYLRRVAWY